MSDDVIINLHRSHSRRQTKTNTQSVSVSVISTKPESKAMVLFLLYIKAELENISKVSIKPDANICLSVKNPLSDFEKREKIVIDPQNIIEPEGREGECHFSLRWEGNKKKCSLKILTKEQVKTALKKKKGISDKIPRELTGDDTDFVPVLAFECKGLEPYEFHLMGSEITAISEGGVEFDDVDLADDDWADYDEENDDPVSISSFQAKIETA